MNWLHKHEDLHGSAFTFKLTATAHLQCIISIIESRFASQYSVNNAISAMNSCGLSMTCCPVIEDPPMLYHRTIRTWAIAPERPGEDPKVIVRR